MKSLILEPSRLQGTIRIPPSKSISHRAVICAGLAEGLSKIENVILSEDIAATLEGMKAMGTVVKGIETNLPLDAEVDHPCNLLIEGNPVPQLLNELIDCRESGSTLRFMIPLASFSGKMVTFTGQGKLGERPLDIYYRMFEEQGIEYQTSAGLLPLTVKGSLKPGVYQLEGNVSSQFISGLMFLLPLLQGDSRIVLTTELESRGYVDLTLDVLEKFGIKVENRNYREFLIGGGQRYQKMDYRVEGDYSQAAFWIVAGILGSGIECLDLNPKSFQGDREILEIVRRMGANFEAQGDGLKVKPGPTRGTVIDAGQCPDLVPVLAVLASLSEGTTRIINAGRLRIKESDRLKAMATELNKLGGDVREMEDGLIIEGKDNLQGGRVDSWNDHRIAMALAISSLKCTGPVEMTGFESVKKSYPHFWQDFQKLGGTCYERSMG